MHFTLTTQMHVHLLCRRIVLSINQYCSFTGHLCLEKAVTQQYVPVLQVLVQYVLSTYILLVYQSLTLRGLFPTVSCFTLRRPHFNVRLSDTSLVP